MKQVLIVPLLVVASAAAPLPILVVSQPAMAASQTSANFNVTMTVQKQCSVTPPSTLSFGIVNSIDTIGTSLSTTQSFSVNCSRGTGYSIGFSSPNDLTAGGSIHQMKGVSSNSVAVQYNLYDATSGSLIPLDSTTHTITDTGTGSSQTKSLKAQIINYQTAIEPDAYSDTVTMTVTY